MSVNLNWKTIAVVLGGVVAALLVVFLMWFYRPWAPYSPAGVWEGRNAEDRTQFYRSMSDVFPHREMAASTEFRRLPRDIRPLEIAYTHDGEARTVEDYARDHDITGLMVVKDGAVVFEEYWRGETADDLHTSWSVAKSVISLMIGMGIKDGVIDSIDDPAEKYAPVYQGTDYGSTSIRHLLMMSSGIDFIEDYEAIGSDMRKLFFNVFFLNQDVDKFVRTYKREKEAGTEFNYQSPNTIVLSAVVRGAYDRQLSDLAEEKLFAPLGLGNGTWLLDRNARDAKELGYCCINIRLEDYAKIGLFAMHDGIVNGEAFLPEGWMTLVTTPPQPSHEPASDHFGYGLHFWVPFQDSAIFGFHGYNGQVMWVDPSREVLVVMTGADRNYPIGNTEFPAMLSAALDAGAGL
ncbi:serine hydrolase domain-containing protein [Parvularcula marina]|uniref:Class C beta-lactamase-related serine hydrolase n=1 Tax=Parvularcula marina TaxID=2292771 RepID=A0A371RI31_9PROT|nr:serine hydrolase [Parvularcula marina]RFB05082.1 class C beta-lactamase-related serine hydrolase [Parvularcula marina]